MIFVNVDDDTRLARRVRRDITERGRDVLQVLDQYERTVKPSFTQFILPTKQYAHIIVSLKSASCVLRFPSSACLDPCKCMRLCLKASMCMKCSFQIILECWVCVNAQSLILCKAFCFLGLYLQNGGCLVCTIKYLQSDA